jgi:metal-sulfur cluster biosynthetic enzyme
MKPTNNIHIAIALQVLKGVIDPEIGINIVDLGMVYDIEMDDANQAFIVSLTLTSEYCPMGESIMENVKNTLENAFSGYIVTVNLLSEPKWDASMISDEGQELLNL